MHKLMVAAVITAMALVCWQHQSQAQSTQPTQPPPAATVQVPVRSVALFSSGVGYFDHAGTINGSGAAELNFKADQINDILKSLVLQDLDGGHISAVTYPSQDPLEKTLRSFGVDIAANPPLGDLLNQLRGATVTVSVNGEKIAGTILGVEKRQEPAGDKGQTVDVAVLNLISGADIRAIVLKDMTDLRLDDPQLQQELSKALIALATSRDRDKKPVVIQFAGDGPRRIHIGYVVQTPVWKTSYRLMLQEPAPADHAAPPATQPADKSPAWLQGWAIVENQTDNDWDNVQLSLVSGRPISFIEDLYQPLYVQRPIMQPQLYANLRPQTYSEGGANLDFAAKSIAATGRNRNANAQNFGMAAQPTTPGASTQDEPIDVTSIIPAASGADVGQLFEYTVPNVTLARQRSAMIPILNEPIDIERVSIYNVAILANHPLNGVRLTNNTHKLLPGGPLTVLDGATYAGDAQIQDIPAGQNRLLSYGIDLRTFVDATANTSDSALQSGKIVKGVLYLSRKNVFTQDYVIQNKGQTDRMLVIEHPRRPGWDMTDSPQPFEKTDALYRFKQSVSAGKTAKLTVHEQIVQQETIAILPADPGQFDFYQKSGEISADVKTALAKAASFKQAMADTQRQLDQCRQQLSDITAEQTRIRENMRTVSQASQYYTRLLTKLNDQETAIEKTQAQIDELQKTLDTQRQELEAYLQDLNVG